MQRLVLAKQAGANIFRDSENLLASTDKLADAYQASLAERAAYIIFLIALAGLALALLGLMARFTRRLGPPHGRSRRQPPGNGASIAPTRTPFCA